jgi:hypothetical protein
LFAPSGAILVTVPAVSAQAAFLLDFSPRGQAAFLQWIADGALAVVDLDAGRCRAVGMLLVKYGDNPMDYADACLVWLAGQLGTLDVPTIDERDFSRYRSAKGRAFRLLP